MNNKYLISLPYLYPVCPISIDHARMFVVADINARIQRKKNKEVYFPIAAHFSGITAERTCKLLNGKYDKSDKLYNEKSKIHNIFSKIYKIPENILILLKSPLDILYYFTYQILTNLKSINISCDYSSFYMTNSKDFEIFVKVMFEYYEKNHVLVMNEKNELALNYSDKLWKKMTFEAINKIEFIQKFHKNNVIGTFENVREDFGLLRDYGIGIRYNEKYVIDPMFDSDLFTLFDLYMKTNNEKLTDKKIIEVFRELFACLSDEKKTIKNRIVKDILDWLPCNLFVCEEHLKTWIVKKTYSETLLLDPKYRTQKYFITGMGKINNERMSSSRGTAILLKDLIDEYGEHNARLVILMTGGHPSKIYSYDTNLPQKIKKMTQDFKEYLNYLNSIYFRDVKAPIKNIYYRDKQEIEKDIEEGYYQQAIIHIMKIMPKKNKNISPSQAKEILKIYKEYLDILVPDFMNIEIEGKY